MTYRELLEQYKKGELDKEEAIKLEADLEKHDAISTYLFEEDFKDDVEKFFENELPSNNTRNEQSDVNFMLQIKQTIRRSFLKLGISVFVITVVFMLFVLFALPKMVSYFYYNPAKTVVNNLNQVSLDMSIYTNLVAPGSLREYVSAQPNGYGNYDICIYQNVSYNDRFTNLMGKISRGKLTLYDVNILKKPTGNVFGWFQITGDKTKKLSDLVSNQTQYNMTPWGGPAKSREYLKELDEKDTYVVYVTLNRMMPYEEFSKFLEEKTDNPQVWCAVDTEESESQDLHIKIENIGFWNNAISFLPDSLDFKKYPELIYNDTMSQDELKSEKQTKTHFISMLRYMADQKEFLQMMQEDSSTYLHAANYIEKNGIHVYGFALITDKETAMQLDDLDEVYQVYAEVLR